MEQDVVIDVTSPAPATAITLGEVHTGLVQNSTAVATDTARHLLAAGPQDLVRTRERPVRHAVSPPRLTGVDTWLPGDGKRVRCVGTVATEVSITGGRVQQASSVVRIEPAEQRRRLPWSHYLTRPGVAEALATPRAGAVAGGFLDGPAGLDVLDLEGVCSRSLDDLLGAGGLDGSAPLRAARTRLRWAGVPSVDPAEHGIRFSLDSPAVRTVRVTAAPALLGLVPDLCRDLALHDWLLSSLLAAVDSARIGDRDRAAVVRRLRPAVDHLLHVWMPAVLLPDPLRPYWDEIERRSGFSRQWDATVRRVRDQIALATVDLTGVAG